MNAYTEGLKHGTKAFWYIAVCEPGRQGSRELAKSGRAPLPEGRMYIDQLSFFYFVFLSAVLSFFTIFWD